MLQLLHRRRLLAFLAGGGLALAACEQNEAVGRRQFIVVSDDQLTELSRAAWADALRQTPVSRDPALLAVLRQVGPAVARASGRTDLDWEFVVFDDPQINAFVLPGGKVGFFRGLLEFSGRSAEEVAAVMGHEVGHVVARHSAERMSQQLAVDLGARIAGAALSEEYGQHAQDISAALGMGLLYGVILPYSRRQEFEADRLGVRLAAQASFDPAGAVRFWRRMLARSEDRREPLPFLSTHPADTDRLAALQTEIAKL